MSKLKICNDQLYSVKTFLLCNKIIKKFSALTKPDKSLLRSQIFPVDYMIRQLNLIQISTDYFPNFNCNINLPCIRHRSYSLCHKDKAVKFKLFMPLKTASNWKLKYIFYCKDGVTANTAKRLDIALPCSKP